MSDFSSSFHSVGSGRYTGEVPEFAPVYINKTPYPKFCGKTKVNPGEGIYQLRAAGELTEFIASLNCQAFLNDDGTEFTVRDPDGKTQVIKIKNDAHDKNDP